MSCNLWLTSLQKKETNKLCTTYQQNVKDLKTFYWKVDMFDVCSLSGTDKSAIQCQNISVTLHRYFQVKKASRCVTATNYRDTASGGEAPQTLRKLTKTCFYKYISFWPISYIFIYLVNPSANYIPVLIINIRKSVTSVKKEYNLIDHFIPIEYYFLVKRT